VDALSDIINFSRELPPANLLNASRKVSSVKSVTTFKCIALVLAQVNKHMYTSCSLSMQRTNKALVKSTPVTLNGAAHNVLDSGSEGASGVEYSFPETFVQVTHFLS